MGRHQKETGIVGGRRCSIRLSDHDYSGPAGYLVTLCTYKRARLFGRISEGTVQLSPLGQIAQALWIDTSQVRPGIVLDAFIIMPDHLHGIVFLPGSAEPRFESSVLARPRRSLGSSIAGYKSACTSHINAFLGTKGFKVWQRNYHERVIRDACALEQMRRYIAANPARLNERRATWSD